MLSALQRKQNKRKTTTKIITIHRPVVLSVSVKDDEKKDFIKKKDEDQIYRYQAPCFLFCTRLRIMRPNKKDKGYHYRPEHLNQTVCIARRPSCSLALSVLIAFNFFALFNLPERWMKFSKEQNALATWYRQQESSQYQSPWGLVWKSLDLT